MNSPNDKHRRLASTEPNVPTARCVDWGAPGVFPHPNANPNPNPTVGEKLPERLSIVGGEWLQSFFFR